MEFLEIFTLMNWLPALLLAVGIVFIIAEVFSPGFGVFGILGSLSLVVGVIVRIAQGLNLNQSIMLILIVFAFFVVAGLFMVFSARFGLLGQTGLFENNSSLPKTFNKPDKKLQKLVGESGKTVTKLDLAGKAKINGNIYDVLSINSFIEEGKHIKVVKIKDNTVLVRKWFE